MRHHQDISCRMLTELASGYDDADVKVATLAAVTLHVAGCTGCRSYLAQLRATSEILRRTSNEPLDPRYREQLLAAFSRSRRSGCRVIV